MSKREIEKGFESILNRAELRRLEKSARDKDKKKLLEWAIQFENQVAKVYQEKFKVDLSNDIEIFILTIIYTLHYNESTKFGSKRIDGFMKDLIETVDMFRRDEADPEDYRKQLADDGIIVKK